MQEGARLAVAHAHNVALCAAAMLALWTLVGLPIAGRLVAAPVSWLWAPALGFAVQSTIALPLLSVLGMTRLTTLATSGVFVAGALAAMVLQKPPCAKMRLSAWLIAAVAAAALLALAPAAGVLPKATSQGVTLSASIFDHSKIAMVDEMIRSGVPLKNPFYFEVGAPDNVAYYYLWHFGAALVAVITGVSGWEADAALTGFTAFASLLLIVGLAARLGARPWALVVVVVLAGTASLRPLLETVAPAATKAFIGGASGLGGWLFQGAWAPQHLASASCVVLACLLLQHTADRRGWLAPVVLGLTAAAGFECSVWVGGVTFALAAAAIVIALLWSMPAGRRLGFLARVGLAGGLAVAIALPFLRDQLASAAARGGGSLIVVAPVAVLGPMFPTFARRILDLPAYWLVYLPIELTAFYPAGLAGLFAMFKSRNTAIQSQMPVLAMGLLALASLVAGWLLRSVVGDNNDLGWRAVLPGVLLLMVFAALAVSRRPTRPGRAAAAMIVAGIVLTLPDSLPLLREDFLASRTPSEREFAQAPSLWQAVRAQTAPDERIANNPLFLADMTPWPVNISWALLADRRSCYAGNELAIAFAPVPAAVRAALERQFARIFEGAPEPDDIRQMANRFHCDVVVLTPRDAAWRRDPFAAGDVYRLLEERKDSWRLYRRVR